MKKLALHETLISSDSFLTFRSGGLVFEIIPDLWETGFRDILVDSAYTPRVVEDDPLEKFRKSSANFEEDDRGPGDSIRGPQSSESPSEYNFISIGRYLDGAIFLTVVHVK